MIRQRGANHNIHASSSIGRTSDQLHLEAFPPIRICIKRPPPIRAAPSVPEFASYAPAYCEYKIQTGKVTDIKNIPTKNSKQFLESCLEKTIWSSNKCTSAITTIIIITSTIIIIVIISSTIYLAACEMERWRVKRGRAEE